MRGLVLYPLPWFTQALQQGLLVILYCSFKYIRFCPKLYINLNQRPIDTVQFFLATTTGTSHRV